MKIENNDRIIVNGEATQESVATNRNEEQQEEEGNEARSKPNKRNDDEHNESLIRESRLRQRTAISYNPGRSQNNGKKKHISDISKPLDLTKLVDEISQLAQILVFVPPSCARASSQSTKSLIM